MIRSQIAQDDVEQARYTRRLPPTQSGGVFTPAGNNKITVKLPGNGLMWDPNRSYLCAQIQVISTAQTYAPSQPWMYSLNVSGQTNDPALNSAVGVGPVGQYWISIGGVLTQPIFASDSVATIMGKLQAHPVVRKYSQNSDGWAVAAATQGNVGLRGIPQGARGPSIVITSPSANNGASLLGTTPTTDQINISYCGNLFGTNVELLNLHPVLVNNLTVGAIITGPLTVSIPAAVRVTRIYPAALEPFVLGGVQQACNQLTQLAGNINGQIAATVPLFTSGGAGAVTSNNVFDPANPTTAAGTTPPSGSFGTGLCDTCALPQNIANLFNRVTFRVGSTSIADVYNYNLIQNIDQILHSSEEYVQSAGKLTQGYGEQQQQIDGFDRTNRSMQPTQYAVRMMMGPMNSAMVPLDPLGNTNVEVDFYLEQPNNCLEITQYARASTTANAATGNIPITYNAIDTSASWSYQVSNLVWVVEYVKPFEAKRQELLRSLPVTLPFTLSQFQSYTIPAGTTTTQINILTRVSNLNKIYFLMRPTALGQTMLAPGKFDNFVRNKLQSYYIRVDTQNYSDPINTEQTSPEGFWELQKLFLGSPNDYQENTVVNTNNYPGSLLDQVNTQQGIAVPFLPTGYVPIATQNTTLAHTRRNYFPLPFFKDDGNLFYFGVRMQRTPYRNDVLSGVNTSVTSATIILTLNFAGTTDQNMDLLALSEYDVLWQIAANSSAVNQ